jgi:F-type H+-transporting ATPase subunit delta
MITTKRIDIRYAKALLDIAKERGVEKVVYNDMHELRVLAIQGSDFKNFLKSPTIKTSQKAHILKVLFKDVFHELTLDFLLLILKKVRAGNIMNIATAYLRMYRIENHLKSITVYTEKELFSAQKQKIEAALSKQMPGETIELFSRTRPGLIGGFYLRWDDYFYDGTIAGHLKKFRDGFVDNLHKPQI